MPAHKQKYDDILAKAPWKQALRIQGNKAVARAYSVCGTYQGCAFVSLAVTMMGCANPMTLVYLSLVYSQSVLTFLCVCFCCFICPLLPCLNSYIFYSIQCRTYYLIIKYPYVLVCMCVTMNKFPAVLIQTALLELFLALLFFEIWLWI